MNHGAEDGEDNGDYALIEDAIHESPDELLIRWSERGRCRACACVGNVTPHSNYVKEFK